MTSSDELAKLSRGLPAGGDEAEQEFTITSDPDEPFFDIPHAAPGAVKLTPLVGRVQLSGDESFEI